MAGKAISFYAFLNVTHLDIRGVYLVWTFLDQFPNLTHLCAANGFALSSPLAEHVSQKDAGSCPFQVIILAAYVGHEGVHQSLHDPRYILLNEREVDDEGASWFGGVNGAMDLWEFADCIVVCRKGQSELVGEFTF